MKSNHRVKRKEEVYTYSLVAKKDHQRVTFLLNIAHLLVVNHRMAVPLHLKQLKSHDSSISIIVNSFRTKLAKKEVLFVSVPSFALLANANSLTMKQVNKEAPFTSNAKRVLLHHQIHS